MAPEDALISISVKLDEKIKLVESISEALTNPIKLSPSSTL